MKTIFIVEDDQSIGDMLQEVLQKEGFRVQRAYSGTEAALLLGQGLPDLVLLDLMLPGLPGEELLGRLQGVPVIVVSAKAGLDDKVDLLLRGAADYITKPFEIRELLARVQVQLRRSEQPAGQALEAFCAQPRHQPLHDGLLAHRLTVPNAHELAAHAFAAHEDGSVGRKKALPGDAPDKLKQFLKGACGERAQMYQNTLAVPGTHIGPRQHMRVSFKKHAPIFGAHLLSLHLPQFFSHQALYAQQTGSHHFKQFHRCCPFSH